MQGHGAASAVLRVIPPPPPLDAPCSCGGKGHSYAPSFPSVISIFSFGLSTSAEVMLGPAVAAPPIYHTWVRG